MFELIAEHVSFGGVQRFYRHASTQIGLPMRFAVYLPPQASRGPVPGLFYLSGLTCTEETFVIKAGAQRMAAQRGLALIVPDTSPRGTGIEGESAAWDFGAGAGFYLDATEQPWARHYRMYSYLVDELRPAVSAELPIDGARIGIFGHSMGGHGALTIALRNPTLFRSVSAFAPIAAPMQCAWGEKAFSGYLGANRENRESWRQYDASELMLSRGRTFEAGILIDQGLADSFLAEQLRPEVFESACATVGQPLTLRRHAGYDHGYYFISTFIDDHLKHHANVLFA